MSLRRGAGVPLSIVLLIGLGTAFRASVTLAGAHAAQPSANARGHSEVRPRATPKSAPPARLLPTARPTRAPRLTATPKPTKTPIPTPTALPEKLIVTSTADTSPCPSGPGNPGYTLRCAIQQANSTTGGRAITFAIPAADPGCHPINVRGRMVTVCTIFPIRSLPPITASSISIDGYTQPGAAPSNIGSTRAGDNAVLTINVDGARTSGDGIGLSSTSSVSIRGLSITNFHSGTAITASASNHVSIAGNFLGVGPEGSLRGNAGGIRISKSTDVTVGGTSPDAHNVISGNRDNGVVISTTVTAVVEGNLVGVAPDGSTAGGNGNGLVLDAVQDSSVGSTAAAAGNVISGSELDGIAIDTGIRVKVQGNLIGLAGNGSALGNRGHGIALRHDASGVTIERNTVAYSGGSGILIGQRHPGTALSARISRNLIFSNTGLGIDISPSFVSNCVVGQRNHKPVMLTNPDRSTPCPVIKKATTQEVIGSACRECTVEVYVASAEGDDQGFGEGKAYLGTVVSRGGTWKLALRPGQLNPKRQRVTATATTSGASPSTSEFALDMPVNIRFRTLTARFLRSPHKHHKIAVRVTWQMIGQSGIVGFSVASGRSWLTSALISTKTGKSYQFTFHPTNNQRLPTSVTVVTYLENGVAKRTTLKVK